ncbi:Uncharacterised protein [Yersinia aleksiciae]|uniref:Uncharacterized protein n=1 Tax=Yersinia aleksiciae TaxID=263819 RepID=A0A0T9TML1_YERAE|nr:Uncharacterised protein [Yersinia aleksiciae]
MQGDNTVFATINSAANGRGFIEGSRTAIECYCTLKRTGNQSITIFNQQLRRLSFIHQVEFTAVNGGVIGSCPRLNIKHATVNDGGVGGT